MNRKRTSIIWKLDKKILQKVVKNCNSLTDIVRHFGFAMNGSMYKIIKKRLDEDGIDYSHIRTGLDCNKGRKFKKNAIPLKDVMVIDSTYNRGNLKIRLLNKGILKNECSICGQKGEWNNKELKMVLDHINGVSNDNRLKNLRMVCPNCNSQLDTTNGKNRRKKVNCKRCGCVIGKKSTYCISCSKILFNKRKVENRPSQEELEKMVNQMPMTKIGKKYGVSDNAVRKWCKVYGIKLLNRRGYWSKQKSTKKEK